MASNLRLRNLDDLANEAILLKKAEVLMQGKEYTKEACVYEILYEWLHIKKTCESTPKLTSLTFNLKK